ncbi:hypothetical protein PTSG_00133 [Salpingoeca rosetta]|uniref:Uncharacterized protein n=1 Tax=Salpingoeca rosetta (strain ATCC 50818 / BSB-021) TaxID=946362 RepID=F2TVM0_SALR5|nr:uncharacterized protein PTSG_00133 [Salpingoeca rosetta]EGD72116.1 hypothetical protein PTSG_00133 [Salpingoeca rosetta]|eukprot:XP_004998688.1 hypothetical protein PTSG_00133 [Salpingoeca rosetta]
MSEGGGSARRVREGVSRSYATENKALDALGEEAEARARERRRKREEARALRLQQKLNEAAQEQRSKEDSEYRKALEDAKQKAKQRREKSQREQQRSSEKSVTETLEEVDDLCKTVLGGPDRDNESVLALHERVRLLASHLRDTLLHVNRLQNHKITVQYDREKLRDRINDLEEDLAEARVSIRQHKDAATAERAATSRQATRIAELKSELEEAISNNIKQGKQEHSAPEDGGGSRRGSATLSDGDNNDGVDGDKLPASNGPSSHDAAHAEETARLEGVIAELRDEVQTLQDENEELKKALEGERQRRSSADNATEGEGDLDSSLDLTTTDPAAAANRIRHLERQNKRLKAELKELESMEEDQRSENKKLKRQMRNLEADKESLEELIKAKDEQLKKLRDRRRQHLGALATASIDEV